MSVIEQIKAIDLQIAELKNKRDELAKQSSFVERLKLWTESNDLKHEDSIIDESEYPNLYAFFSDFWEHGNTYYIYDSFEEEIDDILSGHMENVSEESILAIKEAVDNNLESFSSIS